MAGSTSSTSSPASCDFPRRFVAADAVLGDLAAIEPYYRDLEGRALGSRAAMEALLADWSELDAWLDEESSLRYVAMTCHTDDTEIEKRYLDFVENVAPQVKVWTNRLERKVLDCAHHRDLPSERFEVWLKQLRARVDLFDERNVPLATEDDKLSQQYQKIVGGMSVQHDGREQTLEEMSKLLESPDRAVRREAWEKISACWTSRRDEVEQIFDAMVRIRHQMAVNKGLKDYREYAFRDWERFDYTPADCEAFAASVEKLVVPAAQQLAEQRRQQLGLDALRPWDMDVDPQGREPLTPFKGATELIAGCGKIFSRVGDVFAKQFARMVEGGLLDLESRKGKAPGGYMTAFEGRRLPFIFMNAVGTQDDVQTMLHEGGHAFHVFSVRDEPMTALRQPPIEFAEVASMGMELLAAPHLTEFYSPADAKRAHLDNLQNIVRFFPWMSTIDMFQHWVYSHPTHTREDRRAAWTALNKRFNHWVDYSGMEDVLATNWHRKNHPFTVPFYYVEYGIAQLGALGVYFNSRRDYAGAVKSYQRGLALGGRRPLPELFAAAGVKFDFSAEAIAPLIAGARGELAEA
ncbi:Oligoendopeptidase F, plasmid [Phycisphaerae bacterium RAS2]|nr:Oligoendopeptidase F, plasmid [Phycisphaerae bacterium RAS2]